MASEPSKKTGKGKSNEEVFAEFQNLRGEQRGLANSLTTLETDLKEYRTVIDTLKTVDENRKCFRLIGGVLCERTCKDVLPQLVHNKEQMEKLIVIVTEQLTKKGIEINKLREEHNIKIRGQDAVIGEPDDEVKTSDDAQANRNVLVVNN